MAKVLQFIGSSVLRVRSPAVPSKAPVVFYGFPAKLIAEWCGVTVKTAEQWKSGAKKPSRQALRLFGLHKDGKVLGSEWTGWTVHKASIADPDGNVTTLGQLYGYSLILQWIAAIASRDPESQEQYYAWLSATTPVVVTRRVRRSGSEAVAPAAAVRLPLAATDLRSATAVGSVAALSPAAVPPPSQNLLGIDRSRKAHG